MEFKCICADPPWKLCGGKNGKGGWSKTVSPDAHYHLMELDDILALPVQTLTGPDAHLWLWVPNGLLPDGLEVMRAWGFRYINNVVWNKTGAPGLGQYIRTRHEICLFGVKGKIPYARGLDGKRQQIRSTFSAPRGEHSAKPPEMRKMIEIVSPGPYVELFARKSAENWSCFGDEVDGDVVLVDDVFTRK